MNLSTIIMPEDVLPGLAAPTKSSLIRKLAAHAAGRLGVDEATIRAALLAREDLGSTGIGGRVAIPHAVIPGIAAPFGTLAILKRAVAFDAVDGQPVDIAFLLLTPPGSSGDHLKILSAVARRTADGRILELLRNATSAEAAHAAFVARET